MPLEFSSNPRSASSKSLKIGIVCGGSSAERKISLKSGRAVRNTLHQAGYSTIMLDPRSAAFKKRLGRIDVAFLALHGEGGEDGVIQRFLEKQRVPYTGSAPAASQRTFDKAQSKRRMVQARIPTAPYRLVNAGNWRAQLERFPMPFFIKPTCEGSSIGAFAVEDFPKSAEKLRSAVKKYGTLLVESKIDGREFTVGILGDRALPVVELRPRRAFYDFRAKYTKGMTEYLVPAPISRPLARKLQRIALKTHRTLGLRDYSRVDIMTDRKGRPFVLEANSIPGFTEFSLFPKAARAAGIPFDRLCGQLIDWAWQRGKRQ